MHTRRGDVFSITLTGLSASLVHVNATIEHDEFGTFELTGLDEDSWELTRRRVAPAVYNTLKRNDLEIAVEITPTGTNNHGGQLDLAIAVAVLLAFEQKTLPSTVVLGDLSWSGDVQHVRGILPALKAASTLHAIRHALVPRADAAEAAHAGLDVRVVDHLRDVLDSLRGSRVLDPAGPRRSTRSYERDLAEKPFMMASVRRALEIAAAGQHPLLIIWGAGRTSAALKLPALLPSMTADEAIEVTSIYSIAGLLEDKRGLLGSRPIRLPNYRDATVEKFLGRNDPACPGGVRPGEVSLAHGGVLFLDELLEFRRSELAALAVALAKGESTGFPARPLLVGAEYACPCGFRGDEATRPCTCTRAAIERHERRLRAEFDRYFDMKVVLPPAFDVVKPERSEVVRRRVAAARVGRAVMAPGSERGSSRLRCFAERRGVSPNDWPKVLRVARTIAALAGSDGERERHVHEGIRYLFA